LGLIKPKVKDRLVKETEKETALKW